MEGKKQKRSFFAIIPSVALRDKRLTSTDKLVLAEIYGLINSRGWCYPSNQHFAEVLGISERQVRRSLTRLRDCGYIDFFYTENGFRVIFVKFSVLQEKIQKSLTKMKANILPKYNDITSKICESRLLSKEEWIEMFRKQIEDPEDKNGRGGGQIVRRGTDKLSVK